MNPRPCSTCHGSRAGVITETFTDDASAFRRHAQLVEDGQAPSLCMRRDGTRNVCHLAEMPPPRQFVLRRQGFSAHAGQNL